MSPRQALGLSYESVRMLLAFLATVVLFLLFLWLAQRRMIYFPAHDVPSPQTVGLARAEQVSFRTDDGIELGGWWVPSVRPSGAAVIVFNGNAGHRAYRAPLAEKLARAGVSVLLFDYRGYGGNSGSPTEDGLARDARAALGYARQREGVDPKRIAYFGESLGAAVAVRLATEAPPSALVLRSPFASLGAVGQHHYPILPVRRMLRDKYASIDRIRQVRSPLLVISAQHDSIVPAEQSRELYEAADDPKRLVIIEGADHNDYELLAGDRLVEATLSIVNVRQ